MRFRVGVSAVTYLCGLYSVEWPWVELCWRVPSRLSCLRKRPPQKTKFHSTGAWGGGDTGTGSQYKCRNVHGEGGGATKTRRQRTTTTKATGTSSEYSGRNNTGGEWGGNTGEREEMNNNTHTLNHTHTHTHTHTCVLKADIVCHLLGYCEMENSRVIVAVFRLTELVLLNSCLVLCCCPLKLWLQCSVMSDNQCFVFCCFHSLL